jgi:hypothetical protein
MALPAPYLSYLQALNFDPEDLEYLDSIYTHSKGNLTELNDYLRRQYGITPQDILSHQMGEREAPVAQQRTAFRLKDNPIASQIFSEEIVDEAIKNNYNPSMFINYGKPGNNDYKARVVASMLKKNLYNEKLLAEDPDTSPDSLLPMTSEENIEALSRAGGNLALEAYESGSNAVGEVKRTLEPITTAAKSTLEPVYNSVKKTTAPLYKNYIETPVKNEIAHQKSIYNTLRQDPEATIQGAKDMANDYGNYARDITARTGKAIADTSSTIRNESPTWVARFSKALSEGSNFGKELKDAWNDPDYYLAGGRYSNKGYKSKYDSPEYQVDDYDSRIQKKLDSLQKATGYSTPDPSKLPQAGNIAIPQPQTALSEPSGGFRASSNQTVQAPR